MNDSGCKCDFDLVLNAFHSILHLTEYSVKFMLMNMVINIQS